MAKRGILVIVSADKCAPCKTLTPEYEKAASELSSHDPPIFLAKSDASDEANREVAGTQYGIKDFPSIKILRDGGKNVQNYNGPREAAGIVAYLKKQVGPVSPEIKSKDDAANLIDEQKIIGDATANYLPKGEFDVQGFPTMYFISASGILSKYDGERTKEAIVEFIEKNRDKPVQLDSAKANSAKDEL